MDQADGLADRFQAHHTRLRAVAYQMLGSLSEADDAVQEAWLRVSRAGAGGVDNLGGWLTTVVARVCLDMLRSRAARREEPLGVHLPDPIIGQPDVLDPEQEALLAEGVGLALLVVLDTLAPAERLALVLHDSFAVPFEEIAGILGGSPAPPRPRGRTPPSRASSERSTPSSRPRATGTWRRWSPSWTPTWWPAPTGARCPCASPRSCAVPARWPSRRWRSPTVPPTGGRRWSTAPRAWSW